MNNLKTKMWKRDFTLVVIGQIISLFGNAILRFALPLYLLDITGSSTIYGTVLAISVIPMIILSPVGGIFADRVNKRNIMVALDFFSTLVILFFAIMRGTINNVILISVIMIILYGIQGAYQPTVQASIPLLLESKYLLGGNAVINQVNSLSGLIGPVLGGILYGFWGLSPILLIAGCSFFFSAILEIFIHIPFEKPASEKNIWNLIKNDFKESINFMRNEKPVIWQVMCIVAVFNLFFTSMVLVGLPVLITQILGMSSQMYGYSQGLLMAGGVCGGFLIGILGRKLKIQQSYIILILTTVTIIPIGVVFLIQAPAFICYLVISICAFLFMMISTIFSIQMLAFIQGATPKNLLGKVISCVLMVSMCAQPLGNAMYGILFDVLSGVPWVIIFGVSIISLVVSLVSKTVFQKIEISL